jgi:hypothetical protein
MWLNAPAKPTTHYKLQPQATLQAVNVDPKHRFFLTVFSN